jgi:hypothetical protein
MANLNQTDFDTATVQHYISVVANKIQVLMRKVEEISEHDYTSSSPLALSGVLIRILSRFLDYLRSWSEKAEYQPPADAIRAVYTINHIVVSIIPQLIEAIEGADNDEPAASIIEAYENIVNQVQYGVQTIIHPAWEYNASSNEVMQYLKKVTSSLSQDASNAIFSGAPRFFVIITYPKAEEQIILRLALIAHEVGHFIDESIKKWSVSLLEQQLLNPTDIDLIISQTNGEQNSSEIQSKVMQTIDKMIASWIKEIVSDFLAIAIIGPAYLFAFDEISFSPKYSSPQKLSLSHPPDQLRKSLMGYWVSKMYMTQVRESHEFVKLSKEEQIVFESVVKRVEVVSRGDNESFSSIGHGSQLPKNVLATVYLALKNAMEKAASRLWEQNFKGIENEQWVCKREDIMDALRLQSLLLNGLIPTELYVTPARYPSFAAVMNSGWFHFIKSEGDYLYFSKAEDHISDPDHITTSYLSLQNLIAKGVEGLHFMREYSRRKGTPHE